VAGAEVEVGSGLVHDHGVGEIRHLDSRPEGATDQLHRNEILRLRAGQPDIVAGDSRSGDGHGVAGDGGARQVDSDLVDGRWVAGGRLADSVYGGFAGIIGGDGTACSNADVQGIRGLVVERETLDCITVGICNCGHQVLCHALGYCTARCAVQRNIDIRGRAGGEVPG